MEELTKALIDPVYATEKLSHGIDVGIHDILHKTGLAGLDSKISHEVDHLASKVGHEVEHLASKVGHEVDHALHHIGDAASSVAKAVVVKPVQQVGHAISHAFHRKYYI